LKKFVALSLVVLAACGKRGDPHPPIPIIPQATSDLVVSQRGPNVVLAWSYPSLTTAGKKLDVVHRVVVYRYAEELPAAQGVTPAQFSRLKEKLDSIESAKLPEATSGAKLIYTDTPQLHAKDGRAVRLNYAIVTEGGTTKSDVGNVATIAPIDVPLPPSDVAAAPKAEGVVLTWTAPEKAATVIGYNVYRVAKGDTLGELTPPVNAAPVAATTYTDVPQYGDFDYRVTAVARTSPRIESDLSPVVTATFKDLMPPPAPATITALVETKSVRLVWDAVDAPDLANYVIYRTEGIGHGEPKEAGTFAEFVLPVGTTTVLDKDPSPGIEYKYAVTARDKNGNESKRVSTGWVLVPKAP
jgi:hypothetical protein